MDALVQSAFTTMGVLTRVAAAHDLSLTQLRVLGILRDRRLRMTALADYLGLEKSTLTGLVDRAERRGLLARAPSAADGRAVDVLLAPGGKRLVKRVYRDVHDALSTGLEALAPAQRRRLQALLEQLLDPASQP